MSQTYALNKYMGDANSIYMKLRQQTPPEEAVDVVDRDEVKMLLKKAKQGHIYGRTRHPSLEAKDNDGQRTSTSSEWSDSSGVRPEREAIQRDDSTPEGDAGATVGIAKPSVRAPKRGAK